MVAEAKNLLGVIVGDKGLEDSEFQDAERGSEGVVPPACVHHDGRLVLCAQVTALIPTRCFPRVFSRGFW